MGSIEPGDGNGVYVLFENSLHPLRLTSAEASVSLRALSRSRYGRVRSRLRMTKRIGSNVLRRNQELTERCASSYFDSPVSGFLVSTRVAASGRRSELGAMPALSAVITPTASQ